MRRDHRLLLELIALLTSGALITWALLSRGFAPPALSGNWLWVALGFIVIIMAGVHGWVGQRRRDRLNTDIALLQAAAWSLIRGLENYPTSSSSRRGKARRELVKEFAFKAAEAGRPLPMGDSGTLDLSTVALDIIDRNEKDGSGHWKHVNGLRRGCTVFIQLFRTRNVAAAFLTLTEHIKIQSRLPEGACTNLTELKMLFGFPIEWPEPGLGERLEKEGLHWRREAEILNATRYEMQIFDGLRYTPFAAKEGDPEPSYEFGEIFDQMRVYIR